MTNKRKLNKELQTLIKWNEKKERVINVTTEATDLRDNSGGDLLLQSTFKHF